MIIIRVKTCFFLEGKKQRDQKSETTLKVWDLTFFIKTEKNIFLIPNKEKNYVKWRKNIF